MAVKRGTVTKALKSKLQVFANIYPRKILVWNSVYWESVAHNKSRRNRVANTKKKVQVAEKKHIEKK